MNSHKLTFDTLFSPGTLDTVTYAKYRQKICFIVSLLKKGEEVVSAEEFFPLPLFHAWSLQFHPRKPHFLVMGFSLMPTPPIDKLYGQHLEKKEDIFSDKIPDRYTQTSLCYLLHCLSSDLATPYDLQTLPVEAWPCKIPLNLQLDDPM